MKNVIDFLRCISVNAHSSVRIAAEGTVLYVDPFRCRTRRRTRT